MTAVVLDGNKQTVAGRTVTFSPGSDSTAYISDVSGASDAGGIVTAKLHLGTNRINRSITVSASVDGVGATSSIDVTGTVISVSGNDTLAIGATTTLTFSVKDSAGTPLQGIPLAITSKNGNTIALTPATGLTSSSGQVVAAITASKPGADVINASGAGTTMPKALTISSSSFAFTTPTPVSPATTVDLPLTATTVTVAWNDAAAGGPQIGKQITFASSRGVVTGSPAITNAAGEASVTVASPSSSGPAVISATGPGGTPSVTLNAIFVAGTASTVTVQAIPSTIQITTTSASQVTNNSTITAVVRDAGGNVVKNAGVNFTITSDPSGGSLTAARAITDVSGSASVSYVAGILSSPQNGVKIKATVSDVSGVAPVTAVENTTSLTVAGQSQYVRLGTDNLINASSTLLYQKKYIAIVTDSGGHPVIGTEVRFVLRPVQFYKGTYAAAIDATYNADGTLKTPAVLATQGITLRCDSEDKNLNDFLDTGEDANGNGQLDPAGIASVNASSMTDGNGVATATITYPKNYATWVKVRLEARTGVAGNDPPAPTEFDLPIAIDDVSFGGAASLASTSPYGAGLGLNNTCTNTK